MARESFLLRTDPKILSLLRRWAEEDLRSTNGQLDFILRKALRDAGRLPSKEKNSKKKKEPTDD
jgi:hypothetical protein